MSETRKVEQRRPQGQSPLITGISNRVGWTRCFKLVITEILRDSVKFRRVYTTNEQLADRVGCSTKTVQRCINLAVEIGILYRKTWFIREAGKRFRNIKIRFNKLRLAIGLTRQRRKKTKCPNTAPRVACRRASAPTHFDTNNYSGLSEDAILAQIKETVNRWLSNEPETPIRATNRLFIAGKEKTYGK